MFIRRAVAGSASLIAIAAASFSVPAAAQQQEEPALPVAPTEEIGQTTTPDGVILVTGTRLTRDPNAVAPSPIVSVTAADIRATGQTDVTEVLREIPALISSGTVADSIERGGGGIGQATLNLRGLGSNRTLVLVNGRRHVSGVAGTQTVDIATIPRALIQSVDVLTGGASAIYGADAVTGVVNFNLRTDYDGIELASQVGISERGDGRTFTVDGVWGRNFFDNRANLTVAGSYTHNQALVTGAREFAANNAQASAGLTYTHPDRRFQQGDISAATPNFQQRFSVANRRFPVGFPIPTQEQFAQLFPGVTPTAAELALMQRAANSPSHILGRDPRFSISSAAGLVARADYRLFNLDLDGNGVTDCLQSYVGAVAFRNNFLGGCYVTTPGGGVRPFQDGLITGLANQLGGDGAPESWDSVDLIPQSRRYDGNLLFTFELAPAATFFSELKYVRSETRTTPSLPNTFYDQLYIAPDNPFIPQVLRSESNAAGGLIISRDFYDLPNNYAADRDTYRAVAGFRGDITPHLRYQVYGNYGRTDSAITTDSVLPDRLFAAIDVVTGPNGQPVCASNVDPTRVHPGSEFFPVITPGFFTFTPGPNSGCVPVNLFQGENSVTPQAAAWITQRTTTNHRVEQLVVAGEMTGDTGGFFNMPGGAVQFALGAEYRKEKSRSQFDPLVLGLLPAGSPAGPAGTFVGDIDPDKQSLTFDTTTRTLNTGGEFDVKEVFGELRIPILADRPFFHELAVEGAARYSHYSTVGGTFTWNVNGIFAPIRDLRIRGTYAQAIRAPNIFELFSPQQGTVFRPIDPCDQAVIDALKNNPNTSAQGQQRETNCRAAGIPAGFTDPLTARFGGTTGGNPNLREETAKTFTVGAVLQPRWIPGLTISGDYFDIRIQDAIAAVTAQNIVNSCYDLATFPNQYCELFTRNTDPNSPTFRGLNFLRQTQLNFGRIETTGIDFNVAYNFRLWDQRFALRLNGNRTFKYNRFFDPTNPDFVDPELRELGSPRWSGIGAATWTSGPVSLTYRLQYIEATALAGVEIERIDVEFGPAGLARDYFLHDLSFSIDATERFTFYGGVSNLTDEEPYANRVAYPVSPVGRFFFAGARVRF
jgi:iron complex outermembrane recepter protein